jgi:hypothetical protein
MERMTTASVREIMRRKRKGYLAATKSEKNRILDEVQDLSGYHRKSLVRLFTKGTPPAKTKVRRNRKSKYEPILPKLKTLWAGSLYACGKRLKPFIPEFLVRLKAYGEISVTSQEERLLKSISASSIDRLLKDERASLQPTGRTLTKPGTLLRSQIPVRTFADWDETGPGFIELDLVGHCGGDPRGEFLYTLTMTDVLTGWVALEGMKGRGERGTVLAVELASGSIPFQVKGIDSDNGSEFINYHMAKYCKQQKITFTRCRPYKKNDQCHVEQKNWSVVRQFIGYRRFETDEQLVVLKEIYPLIVKYHNYFQPMMHLIEKKRIGSKVVKHYDIAITPYHKLLSIKGCLDKEAKNRLKKEYEATNPMDLLRQIRRLMAKLEDQDLY